MYHIADRGKIFNILLGVFILAMIGDIMNLKNAPAYPQQIIKGLIVIAVALLQGVGQRRTG